MRGRRVIREEKERMVGLGLSREQTRAIVEKGDLVSTSTGKWPGAIVPAVVAVVGDGIAAESMRRKVSLVLGFGY